MSHNNSKTNTQNNATAAKWDFQQKHKEPLTKLMLAKCEVLLIKIILFFFLFIS